VWETGLQTLQFKSLGYPWCAAAKDQPKCTSVSCVFELLPSWSSRNLPPFRAVQECSQIAGTVLVATELQRNDGFFLQNAGGFRVTTCLGSYCSCCPWCPCCCGCGCYGSMEQFMPGNFASPPSFPVLVSSTTGDNCVARSGMSSSSSELTLLVSECGVLEELGVEPSESLLNSCIFNASAVSLSDPCPPAG